MAVPPERITRVSSLPARPAGAYVLYWMTRYRRTAHNFALQRAVEHAEALRRPLLVVETLLLNEDWASERFHRFALDGMRDNQHALGRQGVTYYPYVEPRAGHHEGLLLAVARSACVAVLDDDPCEDLGSLGRELEPLAREARTPFELVDGAGVHPMRSTERVFARAVDFRRHLQRRLPDLLAHAPRAAPLSSRSLGDARVSLDVCRRWPVAHPDSLEGRRLADLPIDHEVGPCAVVGGPRAARREAARFVSERLHRYADDGRHPDLEMTSRLSKYLRFGHLSVHDVLGRITRAHGHARRQLSSRAVGQRAGFWGLPRGAEAFVDQLVTWRELGLNFCALRRDFRRYDSLPAWARSTLNRHAADPRPFRYALRQLQAAETHDEVWNAAQRQLLRQGEIHNSLRMLWGKKILEWSSSPNEAFDNAIALNDRHALDGRDSNSYAGIAWVFGRYDRAWGPERPVYGTVRYMSSKNAARKLKLRGYLARHASGSSSGPRQNATSTPTTA